MILRKIKELCKQNNISISELEKILQLGHGTINKWSSCQPSVDKLKKVADFFKITIDVLVYEDSYIQSKEVRELAGVFSSLSEEQKNLVKCYISIINKEVC